MKSGRMPDRWKNKVVKPLPYRNEATGEIITDNPPMNAKGFWDKPKTSTADHVAKNKHLKKASS